MFDLLVRWYKRRFTDPHAVTLIAILIFGFAIIYFCHTILAPVLIALVLSYFLEWPIQRLERVGGSRIFAVSIVLILFLALLLFVILLIIPIAWQQGINLLTSLPIMLNRVYVFLKDVPEHYPSLLNLGTVDLVVQNIREKLTVLGDSLVDISFASLIGIVKLSIYLVLIPIMMFFMSKDKVKIQNWILGYLPKNRLLADKVWHEMNKQISNYIRGKIIEIVVTGCFTYLVFWLFDLNYALLLATLVGISVIIPYVGAVIVTIPVLFVALFQFGISTEFWYVLIAYFIVQALDGNLLVPILFSEAVNLHPLIIIMAVLIFGGIWGIWGVFFAIPLASLIKAVLNVWPDDSMADGK